MDMAMLKRHNLCLSLRHLSSRQHLQAFLLRNHRWSRNALTIQTFVLAAYYAHSANSPLLFPSSCVYSYGSGSVHHFSYDSTDLSRHVLVGLFGPPWPYIDAQLRIWANEGVFRAGLWSRQSPELPAATRGKGDRRAVQPAPNRLRKPSASSLFAPAATKTPPPGPGQRRAPTSSRYVTLLAAIRDLWPMSAK